MKRRGLTMIELLITMSIVAILAGMVLFAMNTAQQSAREARTQATIATLHALVMEHYESYRTRRVPIERESGENDEQFRIRRLAALRELMRREMPDRWSDVSTVFPAGTMKRTTTAPGTALMHAYQRQHDKGSGHAEFTRYQGAECLYMLITTANPEARSLFSENQIGDVDGDGLPEFLDGWGNPISFIRWPAGFESELQSGDPINDHDPFDPFRVHSEAYRLVPLIYSSGSDGQYDIAFGGHDPYGVPIDPYVVLGEGKKIGAPHDQDGDGDHWHDNIHNHLIGSR